MSQIDKMDKLDRQLRNEIDEISNTSFQLAEKMRPQIIHILDKYAKRIIDHKFILLETKDQPIRFFSLVTPITRKLSHNKVKKTNRVFEKLQETIENIKNEKDNLIKNEKYLKKKVLLAIKRKLKK